MTQLREALDRYEAEFKHAWSAIDEIADAARTIALPILEGDEELEERLATIIDEVAFRREADWGERLEARQKARKILKTLAALTTDSEEL